MQHRKNVSPRNAPVLKNEKPRARKAQGASSPLNVHVEDGSAVASVPEGLSGQFLLGAQEGGAVEPPTRTLKDADRAAHFR